VEDGVAFFPDGVTEPGAAPSGAFEGLVRQGHQAWNVFVVQRPTPGALPPAAAVDPAYARELAYAGRRTA
jgi:DNA-binding sugar fermentation-stimulating protein